MGAVVDAARRFSAGKNALVNGVMDSDFAKEHPDLVRAGMVLNPLHPITGTALVTRDIEKNYSDMEAKSRADIAAAGITKPKRENENDVFAKYRAPAAKIAVANQSRSSFFKPNTRITSGLLTQPKTNLGE